MLNAQYSSQPELYQCFLGSMKGCVSPHAAFRVCVWVECRVVWFLLTVLHTQQKTSSLLRCYRPLLEGLKVCRSGVPYLRLGPRVFHLSGDQSGTSAGTPKPG